MSRYTGRNAQRLIQSKAGFVSVAAILCLSAPARLSAQPATTGEPPAQQTVPSTQTPATPAQNGQKPAAQSPAEQSPGKPAAQAPTTPSTPLPTVSVTGNQPQRPAQRPTAAVPTRPQVQAPPVQPTEPVAATGAGMGTLTSPGYQASTLGVGRLATDLLNTPQTVNVVTQQIIREQNATTMRDALRNVAGVTFRAGEGGNQGDTPYIRGFSAQNDIFRDGVRDPGWYTRDTFAIDAVEVYKGPASVLFGRGSTGGVINLISKTPFERNAVDTTLTANTGPGYRATVDANGKVSDNLWGRVVAMGQMYDIAGRDHIEQNRYGINPSLMYKPSDQTKITASYILQRDNNIPDYGIPFLSPAWGVPRSVAPVPRGTWYGILSGPTPDTEIVTAQIGTLKIEHNFSNDVKVTNITRLNSVDRLQRNVFPEPNATIPPPPNLNALWTPNRAQVHVKNTQFVNQTDVLMNFTTGLLDHKMTLGYDITRESRDFVRNNFAGMAPTNFLDPDPWRWGGVAAGRRGPGQILAGAANNFGVYIADQISITKYFDVLGSMRYDRVRLRPERANRDRCLAACREGRQVLPSWRVAAVLPSDREDELLRDARLVVQPVGRQPDDRRHQLPGGAKPAGASRPNRRETTEIGAKAEVLNGRLTLQSAVFNTVKTNLRVPNPALQNVTVLDGTVTARGWEASAAGYLTDAWQVITSYAYTHARITKTTIPIQLNAELLNTPTHAFSMWTTYDISKQLQVGAGAFYNGMLWGDMQTALPYTVANTALVPAWWRFDLMAAYKVTPNITMQFNIYNLMDNVYYESAYSNWAVPAQSRTFALTLRGHT